MLAVCVALCVAFVVTLVVVDAQKAPPVWPDAFTIKSEESWYTVEDNGNRQLIGQCAFAQYYDYTNRRMRYDRGAGNVDYFCGMNEAQSIECQLYFDASGALFVNYPSTKHCCQLCAIGAYCTVLKPNWLQRAAYDGNQTINGRSCDVWQEMGAYTMDYWSQDADAVPCMYWEAVTTFLMQSVFDPSTYIVGEPDPSLFVLPANHCETVCNNTFGAHEQNGIHDGIQHSLH